MVGEREVLSIRMDKKRKTPCFLNCLVFGFLFFQCLDQTFIKQIFK